MRLGLLLLSASSNAQECALPEPIPNASVVRNGNKASHTCDVGYCFVNERTRTVQSTCTAGIWSDVEQVCAPCEMCDLPAVSADMEAKFITGTMDAEISCLDGMVIEPGTEQKSKVISCIEGGKWNSDISSCSRPTIINCEDEYMEAVIDKNLLRAKNWAGGSQNIFLSGPGSSMMGLSDVDKNCFSIEDQEGNYKLRINAPFMNQCGTQSTIEGDDYVFSNIVKWRYESDNSFVLKEANVLDFKCVYRGVFMAGLPHKVKLAINTKTYKAKEGEDFTVSMSVYDKDDFTGLVDNIPILHRGKRYFVDLHLHNMDRGTPYLKHCYGSNNYVSEEELREKYRMQTASSSVRDMIKDGCPAPMTLVKLEQSPNTYQSRFSFMFPKIGRGIADLQFVYLHCEIELKEMGFAPSCTDGLFRKALNKNMAAGRGPLGNFARSQGFGGGEGGQLSAKEEMCSLPWMKNAKICATRRRRAASSPTSINMSLGFGPLVVPEDDEKANERPTVEELVNVIGAESTIFFDETEVVAESQIEEVERVVEVVQMEVEHEAYRKKRKILIITCMAVGCFLLFILSVIISSRVSCICNKPDRKKTSKKISTNVLASQIQRELAHASNI